MSIVEDDSSTLDARAGGLVLGLLAMSMASAAAVGKAAAVVSAPQVGNQRLALRARDSIAAHCGGGSSVGGGSSIIVGSSGGGSSSIEQQQQHRAGKKQQHHHQQPAAKNTQVFENSASPCVPPESVDKLGFQTTFTAWLTRHVSRARWCTCTTSR